MKIFTFFQLIKTNMRGRLSGAVYTLTGCGTLRKNHLRSAFVHPRGSPDHCPQTSLQITAERCRTQVEEIDLHKGIMLHDRIGCGITSLMNIIRIYCAESSQRTMMPCLISEQFYKLSTFLYIYIHKVFTMDR